MISTSPEFLRSIVEAADEKVNIKEKLKANRIFVTILLALAGIGIMGFYTLCDTSCSYLQGDILGFDLKQIGMGYMLAIIAFAAFRQMAYVRLLIASGIGVEICLLAFQFGEEVFCPFCLSFAGIVIVMFALNYEKPLLLKNGWIKRILYGLGEVAFPTAGRMRIPLLVFILIGYIFTVLTFSGSTTPAYGAENPIVPSYGSGKYEVIVFTDYFCPPCQALESDLDPTLHKFIAGKGGRVTFVDLPVHKETRLYARYFLYAAKAKHSYKDILHARRVLFSLAKNTSALSEDELKKALKTQGVSLMPYNVKPVYSELNKIIKTHAVKSTPTCIIKYSDTDIRKYTGVFEIQNGLAMLRAAQTKGKREK